MKKGVILGWILLPLCSVAQQQLTLPDAITIALKNSLDIQVAKNSLQQNSILNNYGVAGGLPTVSATATDNEQITTINQEFANTTRNTKRSNVATNNLSAGLTGSILLFNGYKVIATKSRLEQLEQQSKQVLNSQVQNLLASVMTAYFDVVRQQSYIKTINQSIEVAKQKLEIIKTQQSVGMANNADLFQAQLDVNALLQSQQSQELVISQSKTELLRLLTLKADSTITVQDTITVDNGVLLETIENRLTTNPDIAAAAQQVTINEYIVKETAAQRYPALRANGGYSFVYNKSAAGDTRLNNSYGPTVGLSLTVPIYYGSAYKRQQQVAEIDVKNAGLQKQILERDYSANMIKTYQAYVSSMQQLDREKGNYGLARQLLDLVLQRFQLKQATIVEVRQAQQSFEEAGYRLVNLNFAAKSAEIELKRVGSLLQ
ncbi:Outer membrane protein TolC [Filimonas lacunae]|uniref:Outer membrane protein TolC n=1 Tax=Filimonas lacunae TaxID=477680 RepID=A0A173MQ89_9BACT|nr:TolC family protein [Filimonas lacunae]BAV09656.1 outer membrane efflux protein [Filimonas lacunae]SIS76673.1 Outer membrane protein TolC [Filimonas lacunae]